MALDAGGQPPPPVALPSKSLAEVVEALPVISEIGAVNLGWLVRGDVDVAVDPIDVVVGAALLRFVQIDPGATAGAACLSPAYTHSPWSSQNG